MTSTSPLESTLDADESPIAIQGRDLRDGRYPVAVYGLGKLGLPVAGAFARMTGSVIGMDTNSDVVEIVRDGRAPFVHEPGLDELLEEAVAMGALDATTDATAAASSAVIHVVVVPVPLGPARTADLSALDRVVEAIGAELERGDIVLIESTVPPGTCAERVVPALSEISGLSPSSFGVASCPERTQSGSALADITGSHPRIVGGIDAASTDAAATVYGELTENDIITVSDARTAEAVKLFEGVYRDVNIALANEFALAFDATDIDVLEAIAASNTLEYSDIHTPGAGVGGHCIPFYPYFLMEATSHALPLVRTARAINDHMPHHLAELTKTALLAETARGTLDDATIAILGLSYRPGIPETAATPSIPLIEHLQGERAHVVAVDPVIDAAAIDVPRCEIDELAAIDPDAIVLVTAHDAFDRVDWDALEDCIIIDGRDTLPPHVNRWYTVGRGNGGG